MTDAAMDNSSRPAATIEIRLGKLQQLFNSLDPSPFHDRDLDHDAEEYIVGWAEEIALHLPLKLVIHLPQDQLGSADQPALERAIHNYFGHQQQQSRRSRMMNVGYPPNYERIVTMIKPTKFRSMYPCLVIAAIAAATSAFGADPTNGRRLAHRWCEACHVVTSTQRRAATDQAPPFATIAKVPDFDAAKIAFFLLDPHPKMPDMGLSRSEAADLAAYIATLK